MADNSLLEKVLGLQEKYEGLQAQLADPEVISDMKKFVQLNKEYKELTPIIEAGNEFKRIIENYEMAKEILATEKDEDLREMAKEVKPARKNIIGYTLENGNKIYIIAEGRLVNLAAGDGHPAEIMDMSFAIQALSAKYLVENKDRISRESGQMVNDVPLEIDQEVAARKLAYWGCEIDTLTPEQHRYLFGE